MRERRGRRDQEIERSRESTDEGSGTFVLLNIADGWQLDVHFYV
mgnify:CR=1 FL=1